jgi:NADH-quinone oxidoreductase subunit J
VSPLVFLVLAVLAVAAAATVVAHPNPVHGACALVATLFLLAVLFVGLDAQLVGALQVIVNAGAVVVLFLFVIMLLNLQAQPRALGPAALVAAGAAGGVALAALVVIEFGRAAAPSPVALPAGFGETSALAERLFTVYLLPFELTSILLLVAVVGAVVMAQRRR